jgi:1,4-alpha-glucan branching enzyme
MMYAYTENFMLPLSHDEVVHLKRSLLGRMPGDRWQQLANLRLLYTYMWTLPGKKLLFMGSEFAHPWEWDFHVALPWFLLEHAEHRGMQHLVADLNRLYREHPALHRHDFEPEGFQWIDCNDREQSVLTYLRRGDGRAVVIVLNFTPEPRRQYRIGVPAPGRMARVLNSDAAIYGGSNLGNGPAPLRCRRRARWHGNRTRLALDPAAARRPGQLRARRKIDLIYFRRPLDQVLQRDATPEVERREMKNKSDLFFFRK